MEEQQKDTTEDIELKIKPTCKKCGSTQTYLRIKTMERICRTCGNIEVIN